MFGRKTRRLYLLCAATTLGACTVGRDFKEPHANLPSRWNESPHSVASTTYGGAVDATWWNSFHDAELTSLVSRLAAQNFDLAMAEQRVEEGRQERNAAASQGLPQLGTSASYSRTMMSPQGFLQLVQPRPGAPTEYDLFSNSIMASWEADLFGRIRRRVEAARANTAAAEEARHAIALETVSDLALNYFSLRAVQNKIEITKRNVAIAERNTRLVRNQIMFGTGNNLDLAESLELETSMRSTLPAMESLRSHLLNAITLLLAQSPHSLDGELLASTNQPDLPPSVPTGLPSELARRRPDIREAEAKLHAATAQTGAAVAAFYPDISLSGNFGTQSIQFPKMFNLSSRAGAVGPSLDIPIFKGGQLRAELHLRKAEQKEAAIAYQKVVLKAWNEVDDAMVSYRNVQKTHDEIKNTVTEAKRELDVAQQRYSDGTENYLNVIASEREYLDESSRLVSSKAESEAMLVQLYKSLGGGWEYAEENKGKGA
ncbi:hypothetical protein ANI02nite_13890 [Acetobacter nitrogenifigens DSM 23921 = NBRC 105050]|uniref:RND transporter n=2 Tax=Acetobacter nitrogenifigens TaxID=285268 RepID=A0A511X973_9PROT|nr:hypothetical protein ANI02nite_13890 [Acetobacter nitrogenifigens DSM 23921 = NBRC 105050]